MARKIYYEGFGRGKKKKRKKEEEERKWKRRKWKRWSERKDRMTEMEVVDV